MKIRVLMFLLIGCLFSLPGCIYYGQDYPYETHVHHYYYPYPYDNRPNAYPPPEGRYGREEERRERETPREGEHREQTERQGEQQERR